MPSSKLLVMPPFDFLAKLEHQRLFRWFGLIAYMCTISRIVVCKIDSSFNMSQALSYAKLPCCCFKQVTVIFMKTIHNILEKLFQCIPMYIITHSALHLNLIGPVGIDQKPASTSTTLCYITGKEERKESLSYIRVY